MTRTLRALAVLLCSTVLLLGQETELSTLKDLRYHVQGPGSRIVMTFDGAIRNSLRRDGDRLVLLLTDTRVDRKLGAARLKFRQGLVSGVTITRLAGEAIEVAMQLRPGVAYTLTSPTVTTLQLNCSGGEKHPAVAESAPPAPKPAPSGLQNRRNRNARTVRQLAVPPSVSPHIAARESVQVREALLASRNSTPAAPVSDRPAVASEGQARWGVWGFSLALIGSFGFVVMRFRRTDAPARPKQPFVIPVIPEPMPVPEPVPVAPAAVAVPETKPVMSEVTTEDVPGTESEQLARRFQRGREEVELIARVQKQGGTRTKRVRTQRSTPTNVTAVARKLKTGKGEVALALHLKQLGEAHAAALKETNHD